MLPAIDWPDNQRFSLAREARHPDSLREEFAARLAALCLPASLAQRFEGLYLPLSAWIDEYAKRTNAPVVIGICGAQGSGKSTTAQLLSAILEDAFHRETAVVSIDDFYLTREERETLATEVHPLFRTRGVPTTHDVALGVDTIRRLKTLRRGETMRIPRFDKATDTRYPQSDWPTINGPIDLVIFEGWCVGIRAEADRALERPINELERLEDPTGVWRKTVNDALRNDYVALFRLINKLIFLAISDFEDVIRFRRTQEHKLAEAVSRRKAPSSNLRLMSDQELTRFIMHYERLTRHCLQEMPAYADIVLEVDGSQSVVEATINTPLQSTPGSQYR